MGGGCLPLALPVLLEQSQVLAGSLLDFYEEGAGEGFEQLLHSLQEVGVAHGQLAERVEHVLDDGDVLLLVHVLEVLEHSVDQLEHVVLRDRRGRVVVLHPVYLEGLPNDQVPVLADQPPAQLSECVLFLSLPPYLVMVLRERVERLEHRVGAHLWLARDASDQLRRVSLLHHVSSPREHLARPSRLP